MGCRQHDKNQLKQCGPEKYEEYALGKAIESLTTYECAACGARWLHRVESGMGGHGHFWEPLEEK